MEVILREDIDKLGSRGEVVKVAAGYARNFLLPKRLAVEATPSNRKIVEQERQSHLRKEVKQKDEAQDLATLSMGMSGDFSEAIAAGATIVRVGSAIFGEREK